MRVALTLLFALFATGVLAQAWTHYANARFGYEIDVPPGYAGNGESDNGDGQMFYLLEAEQGVSVWGGQLLEGFAQEVADAQASYSQANWAITEQTSTPQWASFSGQRDHRIFHQRMILLCDGESYAAFRAEYNIRDLSAMDPIIDGLTRSLAASDC